MTKQTRLLRDENERSADLLPTPDEHIFKKITTYIRTAPINAYQQESLRRDILQMLLDAEAHGQTAEAVIGADYRAFCDSVIAEVPPLTRRERCLYGLRGALLTAYFLIAYWLIPIFGRLPQSWPMMPVTTGNLVGAALVILIMITLSLFTRYFSHNPLTQLYSSSMKVRLLFLPWFLLYLIASAFLRTTVFSVNFPAAVAVLAMLLLLHRWIDRQTD
ncbi:DUF1048 domain-containing protein [Agathobaculum sp. LCP25S3_E8]|uniref:DUF1048 domain-containing protein n=1 Tax=Agathobaculum sp. LCP25S3_E8 TaxID=3438735 RepID=UPI003F92AF65